MLERSVFEGDPFMPSRTRFSNVMPPPVPAISFLLKPENTFVTYGSGFLYRAFPGHVSRMTDVTGRSGFFNPVDHLSIDSDLHCFPGFWRGSTSYWAEPVDHGFLALPWLEGDKDWVSGWAWTPVISDATLSSWAIEAYNKFHDQVPVKVSLANFLYELKDMKGMIPSIDRRGISKTASNNFLAFSFGVKPFVSDIKAIVNLSEDVDKRLKHLIDMQGKESRLSFERDIVHEEPYQFFKSWDNPNNTTYSEGHSSGVLFKRISARTHFHVGAGLYQDLTDLKDANAKLKALVAAGGFNHPARVIWNAIPYSFVVDWFFSVGKLLDTLSVQPFGGTYEVGKVGYSVSTEATFQAYARLDEYPGFHLDDAFLKGTALLGTISIKRYLRRPGFPAYSLMFSDGMLSTEQQVLALAMLEQKRR